MAIEGHSDELICLLGIINFEDHINEQEVGNKRNKFEPKSIGECKVEVYNGEGSVPHMHVFNNDKSFDTCVCIYSNNYFSHGGKYNSKFSSKQCKEFNKWMGKINPKIPGNLTNWQAAVAIWELANQDCKFPNRYKVKTQPHYEDMTNFKDK